MIGPVHRPAARYSNIDGKYYNLAMAIVRLLLHSNYFNNPLSRFEINRENQRTVFLAASDDPSWLRAHLWPHNHDLFFTADLFGLLF